ncbi:Glucose--fructose oxidoreductase precursor [Pirellulimonas nuda]|uniref:Glucose--fructose oxidoreductase n=1 Tax=Pirellulimonas nuda TaxID=2528009 RepID=A0A518DIH0_9BACT|nr:Gfo/Idh/MocA family oxidoreductase [Pirellulimonas nuda]QDU91274.1 Glucose--fructose oxidoreductase precursor [Pirellulimonas nuda]
MIRIGIAGLGFMGMVHYETYQKLRGAKVVALTDNCPEKRAGDWRSIKGNFGPPGRQMDLSHLRVHESIDDLLADPEVDLVDVTLPPAMHADVAIRALRAGKHVFSEKPLALALGDCDRMVKAADAAGRRLLVGHVLPYFPEYAWALKTARGGKYGRVLGASFKRVISDPHWMRGYWDAAVVGGPMLDLHVHDAHFVRCLLGMPTRVTTRGSTRNGLAEHWHSLMEFADPGVTVHAESGVIDQPGRPFLHGFEIRLERATLAFEFATLGDESRYLCPPTLLDAKGGAKTVDLGAGDPMDAFAAELRDVVGAVSGKRLDGAAALDCAAARDAIALCQRQAESLAKGKTVRV